MKTLPFLASAAIAALLLACPQAQAGKQSQGNADINQLRLATAPFHSLQRAIDAWVLHVWLWRGNPSGLFEDWNPTVSCD